MEYVEGESLEELLKKKKTLSLGLSCKIVSQVASALDVAHRNCIIHRDIKPANILIRKKDSEVKLSDFGIACFLDKERRTALGVVLGSVWYMSPEQVKGETRNVGRSSDIFSLGVVFYEMLTGEKPFTGKLPGQIMLNIVTCEPRAPHKLNPKIPKEISDLVLKMLAKEPENRLKSMKDIISVIRSIPVSGLAREKSPRSETVNRCINCSEILEPGDRYCPFCGTKQGSKAVSEIVCEGCGRKLAKSSRFCPFCGRKIISGPKIPQIIITQGHDSGRVFTLDRPVTRIGRYPEDNDIVLLSDPYVSRFHSRIFNENGVYLLESWDWKNNRAPTNKTFLNGDSIDGPGKRYKLKDNDCIRIGDTFLLFRQ